MSRDLWSKVGEKAYIAAVLPHLLREPSEIPDERHLASFAVLLWSEGRIEEALAAIQLVALRDRPEPRLLVLEAFWNLYLGETVLAKEGFSEALEKEGADAWARFGLGHSLFQLEQFGEAAKEFQTAAEAANAPSGAGIMMRASADFAAGRRPEGLQTPPIPGLPNGMSETLQIKLLYGAEAALTNGKAMLTRFSEDERFPLERFILELSLELDQDALTLADTLLERNAHDGLLCFLRGIALQRAARVDEANAMFLEATQRAPLESRGWGAYGAGLSQAHRFKDAARMFEIAVFLKRSNGRASGDLGMVRMKLGEFDAAQRAFTRAIESGNPTPANYSCRAVCYDALGNQSEALLDRGRAAEAKPDSKWARQVPYSAPTGTAEGESPDEMFQFGPLE